MQLLVPYSLQQQILHQVFPRCTFMQNIPLLKRLSQVLIVEASSPLYIQRLSRVHIYEAWAPSFFEVHLQMPCAAQGALTALTPGGRRCTEASSANRCCCSSGLSACEISDELSASGKHTLVQSPASLYSIKESPRCTSLSFSAT